MAALQSCLPSTDCASFYNLSHEERTHLILESAPDRQIDLYYCASQQKPPDLGAAEVLAGQGRKVLPQLLERLAAETEDVRRFDLIVVLELMSSRHPDVGRDQEVLEAVRETIRKIDDPNWRRLSEESLRRIEED